jgi:hypothetical protein
MSGFLIRGRKYAVSASGLLAILAVEQVAHRSSAGFVHFFHRLAFASVYAPLRFWFSPVGFAARWAMAGEARFIRLQFELLGANDADSDGKCH